MSTVRKPFAATTVLMAITCALAPAYVIRWHIGPLPTTLLEVAIGLSVLGYAIEAIVRREPLWWRSPFTLPAAAFVVAGAIGVVVSPDRYHGLGLYRAYLIEPIVFFLVLGNVLTSVHRARFVLLGLGSGAAVAGVANGVVILKALTAHTLNLALPPPVVIYYTSNAVALYLVPLVGVAASIVLYEQELYVRAVTAVFLFLFVAVTFLSLSRGGLLALAVVAVVLALTNRYRWYLVPGVVAVGIAAVLVPGIRRRLSYEFDPSNPNNTFLSRTHLWEATIRMLRDHPIFGGGMDGFAVAIQPYRAGVYEEDLIYPHNVVLNFWTETGLLGLASFAWILVQAFRTGWRGWVSGAPSWRPIQLGVVLAMAAIVVHGMVDVPYFKNDLSLEFWVLLAMSWAGCSATRVPKLDEIPVTNVPDLRVDERT